MIQTGQNTKLVMFVDWIQTFRYELLEPQCASHATRIGPIKKQIEKAQVQS